MSAGRTSARGTTAALPTGGRRGWSAWLVAVPLVFSGFVYFGLTRNYFLTDDFVNLYQIRNLSLLEYLLTPHAGHALLTRNFLFFLFFQAFGTNPAWYFWAVLLTHLLNVYLLYRVILSFTGSCRAACFGATMFGICPLAEGSLGWYAVYGHVVVATCMLVILAQAARLAELGRPATYGHRALWILLAVAATTSFGIGVGFALALPIVLATLLPGRLSGARLGIPLLSLWLIVPAAYFGSHWAHAQLSGAPAVEAAGMIQLAPEYWRSIVPMLLHLVGFGGSRLLLGYVWIAAFYPTHLSDAISMITLLLSGVAFVRGGSATRRQLAAASILVVACYSTITVGRVALFAHGWEIATMVSQARYHYAALAPLTIIFSLVAAHFGSASFWRPAVKNALLAAWLAVSAAGYFLYARPIDHHFASRRETAKALAWIGKKLQEAPPDEPVDFLNRPFDAVPPHWIPLDEFPGWAGLFVIFYPDNVVDGRRVYFLQSTGNVVEAARGGRRSASLIIPADNLQVPAKDSMPPNGAE